MSTSNRQIAAEVAVFSALLVAALAFLSPDDPWMPELGFQPAWIVVALFAARYGARGLFWSIGIAWGSLAFVTLAAGIPPEALVRRAQESESLLALTAMLFVAWMSLAHEGRLSRSARKLAAAVKRERNATETVDALRDGLEYLRARCDRIEMSLSFWRDVTTRLERGDAVQAARAALDLCAVRCGATAGVVQRWSDCERDVIAWYGAWTPWNPRPRDLESDRTACVAVATGAPTPAADVDAASERDSDVAVPILDRLDGTVVGLIALRGVCPRNLRAADLHDLAIIADWLSPSLAVLLRKPQLRAVTEETAR